MRATPVGMSISLKSSGKKDGNHALRNCLQRLKNAISECPEKPRVMDKVKIDSAARACQDLLRTHPNLESIVPVELRPWVIRD